MQDNTDKAIDKGNYFAGIVRHICCNENRETDINLLIISPWSVHLTFYLSVFFCIRPSFLISCVCLIFLILIPSLSLLDLGYSWTLVRVCGGRQSGLKTGCVVGPSLKTEGVVGPENSADGDAWHRIEGYLR